MHTEFIGNILRHLHNPRFARRGDGDLLEFVLRRAGKFGTACQRVYRIEVAADLELIERNFRGGGRLAQSTRTAGVCKISGERSRPR
jgi:hypothetical protein